MIPNYLDIFEIGLLNSHQAAPGMVQIQLRNTSGTGQPRLLFSNNIYLNHLVIQYDCLLAPPLLLLGEACVRTDHASAPSHQSKEDPMQKAKKIAVAMYVAAMTVLVSALPVLAVGGGNGGW